MFDGDVWGRKKNYYVAKIEYIETTFIPFMAATQIETLDKKSVHLNSCSRLNACI